ncbi:hypothetical protein AB2L37_15145, partial [Staphylococcus pseudintermedius]|uniref:hypothetical protein n=1 Tax=Staphylococcus pseudintermedius TaxID=283734 RepID=UPI003F9EABE2
SVMPPEIWRLKSVPNFDLRDFIVWGHCQFVLGKPCLVVTCYQHNRGACRRQDVIDSCVADLVAPESCRPYCARCLALKYAHLQ